jgi:hypothetical protein
MAHPQAQEFMDTVQLVPGEHGAPLAPSHGVAGAVGAAGASGDAEIWPEAADFQCSQSASLFAGTLPAPLTVV